MYTLALALLLLQSQHDPGQDDWFEIPVFAVQEVELSGGSWMAVDNWKTASDDLCVGAKTKEPFALVVSVTNFNEFYGECVDLRLRRSAGGIKAEVASHWNTDVGPPFSGTYLDLHGQVLIESRTERESLRLAFRLHAIERRFTEASPVVIEGRVELSHAAPSWLADALTPPEPLHATLADDLQVISSAWPDGTLRSRGRVDGTGRRHGRWTTWYADGTKETEAVFRHGEREGEWESFRPDGAPFESGQVKGGMRDGTWIERSRITPSTGTFAFTASGPYAGGKKQGTWVEQWENGCLKARGDYEGGSRVGFWAYWNVDGSLRGFRVEEPLPRH